MTNLIAKCQDATGNLAAAVLLMRIAFWMPKATRRFGGELWIAKSALDWCAETGLSFPKYRRAMDLLKGPRLGFVVVERHKFGDQTITHVRLTVAGRQAVGMKEAPGEQGAMHTPVECSVPTTEHCTMHETAQCPNNGETLMEVLKGDSGVQSHANGEIPLEQISGENLKFKEISESQSSPGILKESFPENLKSDSENPKEGNTDVQPRQPGSVWDVQQKMAEKLHKPDKVMGLEAAWKKIHAEVHGGFVAAFTAKQRGQLKHFIKACPEGTAAAVLETCLRNWLSFTEAAEAAAGIKSSPDKPDVGFLLKHVGTAVNEHLEATAKKQPGKKTHGKPVGKPAMQSIAISLKADPNPEDADSEYYQPASKTEVMAMLGIEQLEPAASGLGDDDGDPDAN